MKILAFLAQILPKTSLSISAVNCNADWCCLGQPITHYEAFKLVFPAHLLNHKLPLLTSVNIITVPP